MRISAANYGRLQCIAAVLNSIGSEQIIMEKYLEKEKMNVLQFRKLVELMEGLAVKKYRPDSVVLIGKTRVNPVFKFRNSPYEF